MIHIKEGTDFCRKETNFLRQKSGIDPGIEVRFDRRARQYILFYKGSPVLYFGRSVGNLAVEEARRYFRKLKGGEYKRTAEQALRYAKKEPLEGEAFDEVRRKLYEDRHADERFLRRPKSFNFDSEKWTVR